MQTLNEVEIEVVAGGFPGLGLVVCGPLASAVYEATKSLSETEG